MRRGLSSTMRNGFVPDAGLSGLGAALAPVAWNGPPPAPTADCGRWVLMNDGSTYTCDPAAWHPASGGPDWGRVALIGLGLAAVVGAGILVWRAAR